MIEVAPCPPSLREVKYKCTWCEQLSTYRFTKDYIPHAEWSTTCKRCGKYTLLRALGRIITGRFRRGTSGFRSKT